LSKNTPRSGNSRARALSLFSLFLFRSIASSLPRSRVGTHTLLVLSINQRGKTKTSVFSATRKTKVKKMEALSARGTWRAHFLGRRRVYSKQRGSSLHDKKKTNNNNTPPSVTPQLNPHVPCVTPCSPLPSLHLLPLPLYTHGPVRYGARRCTYRP